MSLFGKKAANPSKPVAPALNVPGAPPVPPAASISAAPATGRKRITQRLVLGGKGADTDAINSGGSGMKLPGAPDPVRSQSVPMANFTGTVDVPVENILGSVPAEFVVSDHETLYQSSLAHELVQLPLNVVLPLLPSGKIEILAQDLYSYMPEGVMKSGEELGDYAFSPVSLPLPEVISRIPEAAFTLRSDQKPIDTAVSGMDDPFSAEMLAAAQEEAKRAQEEAENAAAATDEPATEASIVDESPELAEPTEIIQGVEEPAPPVEEPEPVEEPQPQVEPSPVPVQPLVAETSPAEADLSFAKTPEYQEMLRKLEEEEAVQESEIAEPVPEESISPVPAAESFSDTEVTKIIPKAHQEELDAAVIEGMPVPEEEESADNPLFAPTRVMPKAEPVVEKPAAMVPPAAPPAFNLPETVSAPAQDFSFKAPEPVAAPEPVVAPVEPKNENADIPVRTGENAFHVSSKLAELLGIRGTQTPTLKDIVQQVNTWPGMKGCIVGGKDGLRISSEVEDDTFANSISAFAPKLISTISHLFNDLGFDDVEEMHTPIRDSSVYIFRKQDLYMIVLFEDTSFPESYRNRIKQVMTEIGSAQ